MMLHAIQEFADRHLPADLVLRLDHEDECPVELVRKMCGDDLGIHLLFVPEEYGGMGGGSFDVCRVVRRLWKNRCGRGRWLFAMFSLSARRIS